MLSIDRLKLDHLFNLTDCTGIIQHCKYCIPDFETGYTTDDNARALIIAGMFYSKYGDKQVLPLITRYLSFLHYGQNSKGKWKNFMNFQRQFVEEEGSEDSFGRSIWALGYLFSVSNLPQGVLDLDKHIITRAMHNIDKLQAYRAQAYSIIGLSYLNSFVDMINCKLLIENLSDKLIDLYSLNKSPGWFWFEDIITYANGILPYSLLKAYQIIPNEIYLKTSLEILNFLDSLVLSKDYLKLIGCDGWAVKGKTIAQFDEQPVDAADMVLAYSEAYKVTGDIQYLKKAEISFKWFLGLNCHNISLINKDSDGCYDGITESGINLNQGAESLFAYIISYLVADENGFITPDIEIKNKNTSFVKAV